MLKKKTLIKKIISSKNVFQTILKVENEISGNEFFFTSLHKHTKMSRLAYSNHYQWIFSTQDYNNIILKKANENSDCVVLFSIFEILYYTFLISK